jgi:hypothetical protein
MHALALLLLLLLLPGCDEPEPTPEELAAKAERDVAMVEAANAAAPPLRSAAPEPISPADMEQHDMYGPACTYAPGTSLGARVIAREGDAFLKLEGEVMRLAADPGSRELPASSRSRYDGREFSLRLTVEGEGGLAGEGTELSSYQGSIDLRDIWGRSVYTGSGLVQCGTGAGG